MNAASIAAMTTGSVTSGMSTSPAFASFVPSNDARETLRGQRETATVSRGVRAVPERTKVLGRFATYAVTALLAVLLLAACAPYVPPAPTVPPTPEHALAVINGDLSSEAEFARLLDELQAGSAICQPEPDRMHVADVLVKSYDDGGKSGTLLEWARAIASIC